MDDYVAGRLRDQEYRLRTVCELLGQASTRAAELGSGVQWSGAAAAAYDLGLDQLRLRLAAAQVNLWEALRDTELAISSEETRVG